MRLLEPLPLGPHTAPNRLIFGPHVTNLAVPDRSLGPRWVEYLAARAAGGCGVIVAEGASVHDSDWPYERAPRASTAQSGWSQLVERCRPHGSLVIASLDHAGGQGSSAYHQRELWAPSSVPEVNSREVPKWMEPDDIAAVIAGFGAAAAGAAEAGCHGVEINAGQHSLVRQFLSGLTNHRGDEWGQDRLLLARQVIAACRVGVGASNIVGLRLSCDELAPWAGITPQAAADIAAALAAEGIDYLVVVRGSIFSSDKTRPDFHEPQGFNLELTQAVGQAARAARPGLVVVCQGSIIDVAMAERAVVDGICDAAEMTRAQIADPQLVAKLARGEAERIRPCVLCNQTCQVRDARNPLVSCIGEPSSGHERDDPNWYAPARRQRSVIILGGGVAGLEAARVAATRGHRVHIRERSGQLGGVAALAGPGRALIDWLQRENERLGVTVELRCDPVDGRQADVLIQATGSLPGERGYSVAADAEQQIIDVVAVHDGSRPLPQHGTVVLYDPIGGPIAVALAEQFGERAVLITQDNIAGNELSRSGDLAPANVRLAQRGVTIERRTLLRTVNDGHVVVEDRYSGVQRTIACAAVVDCGFRLPTPPLSGAAAQVGDCVAPRTILEAVLEARRAAWAID